jgi:hypothetical protein
MRKKFLLFCLLGAITFIGVVTDSCQKSKQNNIETLLASYKWQFSSLQVSHYVGDTLKNVDTLYATCGLIQTFKFEMDHTCSYANFSCLQQNTTGHWSLSQDQLYLMSDMKCQDTTSTSGTSVPFQNGRIFNLGEYSFVIQTGDIQAYYPSNQVRVINRYGFVRVKTQ